MASIISNAALASVGKVVNSVLGLCVTIVVTRFLGVEQYGVFSVLLSYGMLFQVFADFGLYITLTKELGRHKEHHTETLQTITSLRLFLLVAVSILALCIGWYLPSIQPWYPLLIIILVALSIQSLSQLGMGVYQAYERIWPAVMGDTVGRLGQLLCIGIIIFIITTNQAVTWVTISFFIGVSIAFLIHWWFLPLRRHMRLSIRGSAFVSVIQSSWPLALLLILNMIYFRIDMVMISLLRSQTEVGYYALAYKIIENVLFFPAMFGGLLLPALSNLIHTQKLKRATAVLSQALEAVLLAAGFMVTMFLAVPHEIIALVSGNEFKPAAQLLQVLSIALGIMSVGNIVGFVLVAAEKQKQLLKLYAGLVVFNITLNAMTIPLFGAVAAAWATVATECIACVVALIMTRSVIPFSIPLGRVVFIVIMSGVIGWGMATVSTALPIILVLIGGFIGYVSLGHVSGLITKKRFIDLTHSHAASPTSHA